jgi:hypothetical protein
MHCFVIILVPVGAFTSNSWCAYDAKDVNYRTKPVNYRAGKRYQLEHLFSRSTPRPRSMVYTCADCNAVYQDRNPYNSHRRKCKPVGSFNDPESGKAITVHRNEDGVFLCYCSREGCPKKSGFATVDSLRSHIVRSGSRWVGVPKVGWPNSYLKHC